jgi:hypothetical protein
VAALASGVVRFHLTEELHAIVCFYLNRKRNSIRNPGYRLTFKGLDICYFNLKLRINRERVDEAFKLLLDDFFFFQISI